MSNKTKDAYKLGEELGYLPYIVDRFVSMLGDEETKQLLQFNETNLPQTIRLNTLRKPLDEIDRFLEMKQIKLERVDNLPEARIVKESPVPIGATVEYLNGFYFLQGKNSLYPSKILNPKKGDMVADLAAAPGGKTSHLAQIMENEGTIIATEISSNRCRSLKSNLARMGVSNTIVINLDARNISSLKIEFDKILLDAPCSGSGIIVSDSTRKSSKTLDNIMEYRELQISLLRSAIEVLKPKGEIVYSTCSLEPEENESVITEILETSDIKIEQIDIIGEDGLTDFQSQNYHQSLTKARRLYPHKTCGEGFFIVKMEKS
ncbi:RsmB/NOP family class I SAM-dependent RNA methyltransferase [Candidatus Heimdallarchaeota archaeon]|nr:MAG: RsmB/NOP family class I SAM-dependent RNA methyltransferase [Candidatus Heimdallarchaeota archaeon]